MAQPELLKIPTATASSGRDVYSGIARMAGCLWAARQRAPQPARTAVVLIHPSSNFMGHYLLDALAPHGVDVIGANTRYLGNDAHLTMENCVVDLGAVIGFLRSDGYEHVVLVGNSGGGGLAALYQSQAEHPTITGTPAGDPPDLTSAELPPADAVVALMAHPGRAAVFTEWLDPAVTDEHDPFAQRDAALDLFHPDRRPPFDAGFLTRYRAAQVARNRRIAGWVRERITELDAATGGEVNDLPFSVHGTVADPRFVDLACEPTDREAGTPWGPARVANVSPATLAHLTGLRSWLSQWSLDDSNCDGVHHLGRVHVPVLVIYGTADQVCFPSHAKVLHDAVPHTDKEIHAIKGATHYFAGQPDLVAEVVALITDWLDRHDLR